MERKKERIMLLSLQRRQRADEARARADAAAAARRAQGRRRAGAQAGAEGGAGASEGGHPTPVQAQEGHRGGRERGNGILKNLVWPFRIWVSGSKH